MNSILLSVRPEHALNILNGTKTLELRKTIPHDFKGWVYVCVRKGNLIYGLMDILKKIVIGNGKLYIKLHNHFTQDLVINSTGK